MPRDAMAALPDRLFLAASGHSTVTPIGCRTFQKQLRLLEKLIDRGYAKISQIIERLVARRRLRFADLIGGVDWTVSLARTIGLQRN